MLELLDGNHSRAELLALLRLRVNTSAALPLELTAADLDGLLARMAMFGLLTA